MRFRQRAFDTKWDGHILRQWRLERDMNQATLADLLEVNHNTVSRWEGGWLPHIDAAHRIVRVTHGKIRYRDIYRSLKVEHV